MNSPWSPIDEPINLVILGPPGAGKGTQARIVAKTLNLAHIDTGQSLRDIARTDTPLGHLARGPLGQGMLLPDDLVAQIIENKLEKLTPEQGFVLDGFPRTLRQAGLFDALLHRLKRHLSSVLSLTATESTIRERLAGRRVCPKCGEVYHIRFRPPHQPGICDVCKTPFQVRPDDQPTAIERRLRLFHQQTEPVLEHYRRTGVLLTVDANRSTDDVFANILAVLSRAQISSK